MNELIVKLMMQATNDIAQVIRKSEIDYDHDYAEFGHFLSSDKNNRIFTAWKEKFAELIVRECIEVIANVEVGYEEQHENTTDEALQGRYEEAAFACDLIENNIRAKFGAFDGVEE